MPEGDTVWRTATRLAEALGGDRLSRSDLRWPGLSTVDLTGVHTTEVVSRGKHILHRVDSGLTIHSHLRMDGSWRVERSSGPGRPPATSPGRLRDVRAVLGTTSWTAIGLRLGMLDLVRTRDESRVVGHLGPDVLGPDWDADVAAANLLGSNETIGAALLDQRLLAGVGTFWAAECLFLERLDPWESAGALPRGRIEALLVRVRTLMDAGRRHAVQSSTGNYHRGRTSHVHGRSGQPCRRCGSPVTVGRVGRPPHDRAVFFCPGCQRGGNEST